MSLARLHVQFQLGYGRETSGELVAIVALVAISLCPWSSGALLQLGPGYAAAEGDQTGQQKSLPAHPVAMHCGYDIRRSMGNVDLSRNRQALGKLC